MDGFRQTIEVKVTRLAHLFATPLEMAGRHADHHGFPTAIKQIIQGDQTAALVRKCQG
jgi:hypothetical protein